MKFAAIAFAATLAFSGAAFADEKLPAPAKSPSETVQTVDNVTTGSINAPQPDQKTVGSKLGVDVDTGFLAPLM